MMNKINIRTHTQSHTTALIIKNWKHIWRLIHNSFEISLFVHTLALRFASSRRLVYGDYVELRERRSGGDGQQVGQQERGRPRRSKISHVKALLSVILVTTEYN